MRGNRLAATLAKTIIQYNALMGIVILISIIAVAFFVVGLSLTLIFKGRHIDSEIADNKNMQALDIKCAAQQMREEAGTTGGGKSGDDCRSFGCAGCDTDSCVKDSPAK